MPNETQTERRDALREQFNIALEPGTLDAWRKLSQKLGLSTAAMVRLAVERLEKESCP